MHTHRGPVMTEQSLKKASILFGSELPKMKEDGFFSLAWTGFEEKDNFLQILLGLSKMSSADEAK